MDRRLTALIVVAACASSALAGPVQSYTRSGEPSRSEGLRSLRPFITAADPRTGLLITPAPFPSNRVDSPDRIENGRIWAARSPIGNRTPIRELTRGLPGAASLGAHPDALDEIVWVQPEEITTPIAISPWQQVDAHTLRQIQRQEPFLGRTVDSPESARLLGELRRGQHQWLREQGYILTVRTHVNAAAMGRADRGGADPAIRPTSIKPRGVIKVIPNGVEKEASASPAEL
ncbi:MAG: hypothetical protein JNK58_14155 [Phycisphaerae bacterium]|nr:hypothetical protein [Phycisphaerae bacterium]